MRGFKVVNWYTGEVVQTYPDKGGRFRAKITRRVQKMNTEAGYTCYVIENLEV